mmetsp:Transcript_5390/g.8472  ORF Transcript_5390/g.8472 Transcript_5390/m.8472 type:complete len:217 (+) Transcript_5390:384-1034(+)
MPIFPPTIFGLADIVVSFVVELQVSRWQLAGLNEAPRTHGPHTACCSQLSARSVDLPRSQFGHVVAVDVFGDEIRLHVLLRHFFVGFHKFCSHWVDGGTDLVQLLLCAASALFHFLVVCDTRTLFIWELRQACVPVVQAFRPAGLIPGWVAARAEATLRKPHDRVGVALVTSVSFCWNKTILSSREVVVVRRSVVTDRVIPSPKWMGSTATSHSAI